MITANPNTPAHAGEDQASALEDPRAAHWTSLAVQLLLAAKTLANDYLQEECDDASVCVDAGHHQAIQNLFAAIKGADSAGLSDACAALVLVVGAEPAQLWTVTGNEYHRCSLPSILANNDWLRPGDVIWEVQARPQRRVLTEADFAAAAVVNAPARDPRVPDLFETGGAA